MTDDLLKRLDDAAKPPHYIDDETAREAAARIRELEAQVERNAAIAINALERATLAEEWRDHDKERAEAAEATLATARRDAMDNAKKVAALVELGNQMAASIEGNYYIPRVATRWRAAIRAIAAGGA